MKKVLVALFVLGIAFSSSAQFKVGANLGAVIGDNSDFYGAQIGADVYKMFGKQDGFLNFGIGTGFQTFTGKSIEILGEELDIDNFNVIPLAGAARVTVLGFLRPGADIGYAFALNEDADGGFYFRPVVGFDFFDAIELNVFYQTIDTDGSNISSIGVGALLEFGGK